MTKALEMQCPVLQNRLTSSPPYFKQRVNSKSLVSSQEDELPVTSAVCKDDLEASQGEHVRSAAACTELLIGKRSSR